MAGPARSTSPAPASVTNKYQIVRELGAGAYGIVSSAKRIDNGEDIAIKRVTKIFEKTILAKRALREIKLLRHFNNHDNITSIIDIEVADINNFTEVFLVQELMEADLHQIIRSEQPLTDAHFQYFIYQVLRGLKYIHSSNVLHRDLKPGNLLVNADCELKICDFGLARGYLEKSDTSGGFMTEYVATRWYRAPEIMLSFQCYTKAIDMWSVGCIFGELLSGKPLFRGRDYVDQLNQILNVLGTPEEATLRRVGSQRAQVYIRSLPRMPRVPFAKIMPRATPLALDLLEKLLNFDPSQRLTVEEALSHPYLATYHDPQEEPCHSCSPDFSFENAKSIEEIRNLLTEEIKSWKESLKKVANAQYITESKDNEAKIISNNLPTNPDKPVGSEGLTRKTSIISPDVIAKAREIPKAVEEVIGSSDLINCVDIELEKELAGGAAV